MTTVTAPRRQWFDVAGTCTDCDHAACRDCAADGAHHCECQYDRNGTRTCPGDRYISHALSIGMFDMCPGCDATS